MIPIVHFVLRNEFVRLVALPLLLLASVSVVFAQAGGGGGLPTSTGGTTSGGNPNGAFYDYTGGQLPIDVNVWGFVNSPGKFKVPVSTTLIQLISFAGGPRDRARLNDIRILHDMTIDSTITDPVVIFNLDEYQKTGDPNLNPVIYPNDTVIVPGDALNVFREILGIIADISVFIGFIISLYSVVSRP